MFSQQSETIEKIESILEYEGLLKYCPGELPLDLQENIEAFLFPSYEYSSNDLWQKEIQLSRKYLPQATIFVYFFEGKIIATWRSILKQRNRDLPIENARVKRIITSKTAIQFDLIRDNFLQCNMPTGEIGGLRIVDDRKWLYKILPIVQESCEEDCFLKGFTTVYLSCKDTPQIKRLYGEKFGFHEVAEIYYDDRQTWTAMVRKLNPLKLEHFIYGR
jgi:hypothetical protein